MHQDNNFTVEAVTTPWKSPPYLKKTTSKTATMLPPRETIEECPEFKSASPFIGGIMMFKHSAVTWQECLSRHSLGNNQLSPASALSGT